MTADDLAPLPPFWSPCDPADSEGLARELRREFSYAPWLDGRLDGAVALARADGSDDVVFWLPAIRQWALVHLTWARETGPDWPGHELFADAATCRAAMAAIG